MTYDDVRMALEDAFERPLTTEAQVKAAYAEATGFTGDQLEEEFNIAIGRYLPGSPVMLGGTLVEDPEA